MRTCGKDGFHFIVCIIAIAIIIISCFRQLLAIYDQYKYAPRMSSCLKKVYVMSVLIHIIALIDNIGLASVTTKAQTHGQCIDKMKGHIIYLFFSRGFIYCFLNYRAKFMHNNLLARCGYSKILLQIIPPYIFIETIFMTIYFLTFNKDLGQIFFSSDDCGCNIDFTNAKPKIHLLLIWKMISEVCLILVTTYIFAEPLHSIHRDSNNLQVRNVIIKCCVCAFCLCLFFILMLILQMSIHESLVSGGTFMGSVVNIFNCVAVSSLFKAQTFTSLTNPRSSSWQRVGQTVKLFLNKQAKLHTLVNQVNEVNTGQLQHIHISESNIMNSEKNSIVEGILIQQES